MDGMMTPASWESILERFDEAWQQGGAPPEIRAFLQSAGTGNGARSLLIELIKIDLECRSSRVAGDGGQPPDQPMLEQYLTQFPELADGQGIPLELIGEEYRVRRRWGAPPDRSDYCRRFSLTDAQAAALFDPIDAELAVEGPAVPVASSLAATPSSLGPYQILERIGQGWSSHVFRARHAQFNRLVALKVLRKELVAELGPELIRRFFHEMQAIGRIDHPHVIHAYDAGPIGATYFLALEYAAGIDLERLVRQEGPLPIEKACDYARQTAEGLRHIHEQGLVHRDIKPSNLLLCGGTTHSPPTAHQIKILDLGFALLRRTAHAKSGTMLTSCGDIIGSADYLSPEQILDPHAVDHRADLYSLGCTLYFLLTGRPPFSGGTLTQKLNRHQEETPTSLHAKRPKLPVELATLVTRLLAKRPEERPQAADEVVRILVSVHARTRPARRWRPALLGAAALLLIAVAATFAITALPRRPDPPPFPAPAGKGLPAPNVPGAALIVNCGKGDCLEQDELGLPGYSYQLLKGTCFSKWARFGDRPTHCWVDEQTLLFDVLLPRRTGGTLRIFMSDNGYPGPHDPCRWQKVFVCDREIALVENFTEGRTIETTVREADSARGKIRVRIEKVKGISVVVSRIEFWPKAPS
jgi:serine/threonine protein kinase